MFSNFFSPLEIILMYSSKEIEIVEKVEFPLESVLCIPSSRFETIKSFSDKALLPIIKG